VKIACLVADLHGHMQTLRYLERAIRGKCDYLLVAGDVTSADSGKPAEPVFSFLDSLGIPVIAVLGNSDRPEFLEEFSKLKNVNLLHFSGVKVEGVSVIGVSGVQPQEHGSFFSVPETILYRGLKKAYEDAGRPEKFILLSHAPPYGVADELRNGEHVGSKGLRRFDEEFNPRLHVCGHVHGAYGIYANKFTTVINPGILTFGHHLMAVQLPELILGTIG